MRDVAKLLIFSDILIQSSAGLIGPIFAIFIEGLEGGGVFAAGVASMIFLLVSGFGELLFGNIVDKIDHHKKFLLLGTFMITIVPLLYLFVDNVYQLYLVEALSGLGVAISYPIWFVEFSHSMEKKKEGFTWALYGFFTRISMAATAVIGGFVTENFGFNETFMVVGAMGIIGAVSLIFIRIGPEPSSVKQKNMKHRRVKNKRHRYSKH